MEAILDELNDDELFYFEEMSKELVETLECASSLLASAAQRLPHYEIYEEKKKAIFKAFRSEKLNDETSAKIIGKLVSQIFFKAINE